MQEHIQKALTYLNQANYSGYFEEMGNAVPTEMLARFSQFKQEFLHGNLAFDFSQRLETFAKEVLHVLNSPKMENDYEFITEKIKNNVGIDTSMVLKDKSVQDLDSLFVSELLAKPKTIKEFDEERINIHQLSVHEALRFLSLAENGHLFKGAFLCLAKREQMAKICQSATETKFIVFKGTERSTPVIVESVKGNLIRQYEEVMRLLRLHIPLKRNKFTNEDIYEIPLIAAREFVANAFVHRTYQVENQRYIQVELFDDRLEIKSPGSLPSELDITRIQQSIIKNPTIAAVFFLYGYVEKAGTGIVTAQQTLKEVGLEKAEIVDGEGMVKVTIFRERKHLISNVYKENIAYLLTLFEEKRWTELLPLIEVNFTQDSRYLNIKEAFSAGEPDAKAISLLEQFIKNTGEIKPLTMNHKEHLNQLIALGKLGQALEELLAATKENGQEDLANGLVLLASRYHRNEGANQKNTLDLRDYQIELNKITATLLNYVDEYEPTGKFVFKPVRNSGGSTGNNTTVTGNGNIVISQVDNTNININTAQNPNEDKTPPRNTVFISYSHQDKEVAQRVKTSLEAAGMLVTIDSDAIGAGEDIKSFIEKCVAQNYYTLSIVSTKSLSSSWVAMESVNTFYAQKVMEKRFIAAYIDKGFFKRTFVEDALDEVDKELEDIQAAISKRLDKKRNIQDLQNELGRYNDLQHHLPAIVQRLRESLSVDISGDNFENGMQKIVDTMKN